MWHRASRACRLTFASNLPQCEHTFAFHIQPCIRRPVLEGILDTQGARDRSVPIRHAHLCCGCGLRRRVSDNTAEGCSQRLLMVAAQKREWEEKDQAVSSNRERKRKQDQVLHILAKRGTARAALFISKSHQRLGFKGRT